MCRVRWERRGLERACRGDGGTSDGKDETHSELIAEGVETASELVTLRALGAHKAQGYLLGRPVTFDAAFELVERQQAPQAVRRRNFADGPANRS
jgi:predicted signal transduction protein with EAL and GGDEF domain